MAGLRRFAWPLVVPGLRQLLYCSALLLVALRLHGSAQGEDVLQHEGHFRVRGTVQHMRQGHRVRGTVQHMRQRHRRRGTVQHVCYLRLLLLLLLLL